MNNTMKNILVACGILVIFTILFIIIKNLTDKDTVDQDYLKNYEVNEYIPTYVSDEDMAKIYLNDYIHTMYSNIEEAYNLLDEEYRNIKFGNLDNYRNYVNSLPYTTYTLSKYYKTESDGYIIFGVYDANNNLYIFKTQGVMQYKVYLDNYTVEI